MRIGFMFSGQGSEVVGMGHDFYARFETVKQLFDRASDVLNYNVLEALNNEHTFQDTAKIQPLTFLFQIAIIEILKENGVCSSETLGLSLGEYAALYDGGALQFLDGLKILEKRGHLMQQCASDNKGKMVAVIGLKEDVLAEIINPIEGVVIANYNMPKQLVISGIEAGVDKAVEQLKEKGVRRLIPLSTIGAFHSPLMNPAKTEFETFLQLFSFDKPTKRVLVNKTGEVLLDSIKKNMIDQLTSPVKFTQSINNSSSDYLIEIGPKKVLSNMVKRINKNKKTLVISDVASFDNVLEALKNGL